MKSIFFNYKTRTLLALFTATVLSQVSFAAEQNSAVDEIARFESLSPSQAYASKDYTQLIAKIFVPAFEASIAPRRLCVYDRYIMGTEMRDHCSQWSTIENDGEQKPALTERTCFARKYDYPVAPLGDLSPYFKVTFVKDSIEVGTHLYPLQNCSDVASTKASANSAKDAPILIESSGEYSGGSVIKKKPRD
jgi:hypothetical protein